MDPSRTKPDGHPNSWPIRDYLAFVNLITAAGEREEIRAVDRVIKAAADMGLNWRHWLVQETLLGVYGKLPIPISMREPRCIWEDGPAPLAPADYSLRPMSLALAKAWTASYYTWVKWRSLFPGLPWHDAEECDTEECGLGWELWWDDDAIRRSILSFRPAGSGFTGHICLELGPYAIIWAGWACPTKSTGQEPRPLMDHRDYAKLTRRFQVNRGGFEQDRSLLEQRT